MFRAISTRYIGPTNSRGSRIKALARKRERDMPELSLTDNWDHSRGVEDNHARVAKLLAVTLDWQGLYIGGSTDDGYVFVNAGTKAINGAAAGHLGIVDRDWFFVDARES